MLEQQHLNSKVSPVSQLDRLVSLPKILASSDLLGNSKMLIITHAGEEYRLTITSKDKLILTK